MLMTRRKALTVGALACGTIALRARQTGAAEVTDGDGLRSHTADAIHQEPEFAAAPARVYAALLDPVQFDRVVELSGVLQAMQLSSAASRISSHAGGAFALFGGYITGRQLELVRDQRIVQAWRAVNWGAGVYSVARFELQPSAAGCRIVFDQAGFPADDARSLAAGWKSHYWEPLRKLLAS